MSKYALHKTVYNPVMLDVILLQLYITVCLLMNLLFLFTNGEHFNLKARK